MVQKQTKCDMQNVRRTELEEMASLAVKTRKNSSDQEKIKLYFTCADEDFERCFPIISEDILSLKDCEIYYHDPKQEVWISQESEDDSEPLDGMSAVVIPLTMNLLKDSCKVLDKTFKRAKNKNIITLFICMDVNILKFWDGAAKKRSIAPRHEFVFYRFIDKFAYLYRLEDRLEQIEKYSPSEFKVAYNSVRMVDIHIGNLNEELKRLKNESDSSNAISAMVKTLFQLYMTQQILCSYKSMYTIYQELRAIEKPADKESLSREDWIRIALVYERVAKDLLERKHDNSISEVKDCCDETTNILKCLIDEKNSPEEEEELIRRLAAVHGILAKSYGVQNKREEQLLVLEKIEKLCEDLCEKDESPENLYSLYIAYYDLQMYYRTISKWDQDRKYFEKEFETILTLSNKTEYREGLAAFLAVEASYLEHDKDLESAEENYRMSLEIRRELVKEIEIPYTLRADGDVSRKLGVLLRKNESEGEARYTFDESLRCFEKLEEAGELSFDERVQYANICVIQGDLCYSWKKKSRAYYTKGLMLRRQIVEEFESDNAYFGVAEIYFKLGTLGDGELLSQSLELMTILVEQCPDIELYKLFKTRIENYIKGEY